MLRFCLLGLFAIIVGCSGCSAQRTYRGHYFSNFETSAFTPEGSTESWCVAGSQMSKITDKTGISVSADVVLKGTLGKRGNYCSLGAYHYILAVQEVVSVDNIKSGD